MTHRTELDLQLEIIEDLIVLRLYISSPKNYYFEDEYDTKILVEASRMANLLPQEVILKGLFLELLHLGVTVNYEDEVSIKEQINEFCVEYLN